MALLDRPRILFTHNDGDSRYTAFDLFLSSDSIDLKESDYELDTELFLNTQFFDLAIIDASHSEKTIRHYIQIARQQNIKTILLFKTEPSDEIKEKYRKEGVDLTLSMTTIVLNAHSNPEKHSIRDLIYKVIGRDPSTLHKPVPAIPEPKEYIIAVGDPYKKIDQELYALFPDNFTFIFSESNDDCKKKLRSYKVDLFMVYYTYANPTETQEDPKKIKLAETTTIFDRDDRKCLVIFDNSYAWYSFDHGENLKTLGADQVLKSTSSAKDIQTCIYEMLEYKEPSRLR